MRNNIKYTLLGLLISTIGFALISSRSSVSKYRGDPYGKSRSNMVDYYYQDLVNKSAELKSIESSLKDLKEKHGNLKTEFTLYDNESKKYYNDANSVLNTIHDATLREKMLTLTSNSNSKYQKNIEDILTSMKTYTANELEVDDQHKVLKLVSTLTMIEKYQAENKPKAINYQNLVKEQARIIQNMKTESDKY